jgi:hypothetical protein
MSIINNIFATCLFSSHSKMHATLWVVHIKEPVQCVYSSFFVCLWYSIVCSAWMPYIKGVSHELDLAFVEMLMYRTRSDNYILSNTVPEVPIAQRLYVCECDCPLLRMCIRTNHTFALLHQCPRNISKYVKGKVMDIFFECPNILISTFCLCSMIFKVCQKLFTTIYNC